MPNYPPPIKAFIAWAVDTLAVHPEGVHRRILREEPGDLLAAPQLLPTHVVGRHGGFDRELGVDVIRVVVDTFATGPDPEQASDAAVERAEDIRYAVRVLLPGTDMAGIWIARTRCTSAPAIRYWGKTGAVRRAQAIYELTTHTPL